MIKNAVNQLYCSQNNSYTLKEYIYRFIAKYKIYLLSLLSIAFSAAIFEISVDYKIKEIIDTITLDEESSLGLLLGLFVFYKLMHHAVFFLSRLMDIKYKPTIIEEVVTDIYYKTTSHSLHWFDSHLSGEISNKISDFEEGIESFNYTLFSSI